MARSLDWSDDDEVEPLKGSKMDTVFLRENYNLMGPGGIFRTPRARFSPAKIHAEAKKAGVTVRVDIEGPWHKVTVIGRIPKSKPITIVKKAVVSPNTDPESRAGTTPDIFS